MDDSELPAPPPYEVVTNIQYHNPDPNIQYHNPGVTIKQPLGYTGQGESSAVVSSVTAGGFRLDKAKKIGNRLVIDFEKTSCCPWETTGLDPDCKNYVPEELRIKGVTQNQWSEWCDDLTKVQKKSPSVGGCLCTFCFPGFIPQAILCAIFCPISGDHCLKCLPCFYGDWYVALSKWQRKVNGVLNPLDMHAKLKTYKPFQKAPKSIGYSGRIAGKDDKYEMSMWEIALTGAESQKLQEEGWDNGVADGCTSGIGRNL